MKLNLLKKTHQFVHFKLLLKLTRSQRLNLEVTSGGSEHVYPNILKTANAIEKSFSDIVKNVYRDKI